MAATESTMLELGTLAPEFKLPDIDGNLVSISDLKVDKGLLVMFICNHCPFVKHLNPDLKIFTDNLKKKGIEAIAISSNDIENYPQDSPEMMKKFKEENEYNFPYLYDESQETAKAYMAACTPDFFLFNSDLTLYYRGQFDESRPGNGKPVTGNDLGKAVNAMLSGEVDYSPQLPSIGCNIKWKKGNEPEYF